MKYKIRIQVVDYTCSTQKLKYIRDLREFARIAHIQPLKVSHVPSGDCLEVDLDGMPEHKQLEILQLLNLLAAREPHYFVELRDNFGLSYY